VRGPQLTAFTEYHTYMPTAGLAAEPSSNIVSFSAPPPPYIHIVCIAAVLNVVVFKYLTWLVFVLQYCYQLQLQLQNYTLQQKRFVLRGVMQCKLVETSRSSALIETAGDCCVVSECQVEVHSRLSELQWRNFAGR